VKRNRVFLVTVQVSEYKTNLAQITNGLHTTCEIRTSKCYPFALTITELARQILQKHPRKQSQNLFELEKLFISRQISGKRPCRIQYQKHVQLKTKFKWLNSWKNLKWAQLVSPDRYETTTEVKKR